MRHYRPKQRDTAEHHGTLQHMTKRLNFDIPHWLPPYFGGFLPNSLIYSRCPTPISQHPTGKGGEIRNYRPNKGAPRNATEREKVLPSKNVGLIGYEAGDW